MSEADISLVRRSDYLTFQHGLKNVATVITAHAGLIIVFIALSCYLPFWACLIPTLAASWVHQRFLSEMVHESSHYNLIPSKEWNDAVANWLMCYWHGYRIDNYRKAHMHHHAQKEFFSAMDPDTRKLGVTSKKELSKALLLDICGYTAITSYLDIALGRREASASPRKNVIIATFMNLAPVIAIHFSLLVMSVYFDLFLYYLTYMACLVTLYPVMNRIRIYAQHLHIDTSTGMVVTGHSTSSRSFIKPELWVRVFVTSPLMMYHHEHHEKPSLPWRALQACARPFDDESRYMDRLYPLLKKFYRSLP